MQMVTIYERKGQIMIVPISKTIPGFYVEKPPVRVIDKTDLYGIGQAVLQAFGEYQEEVSPPDFEEYLPPARMAAGVRSDSEFYRGLKGCSIELEDTSINAVPDQNKGSRKGLVPLTEEKTSMLLSDDPEIIGKFVMAALAKAL